MVRNQNNLVEVLTLTRRPDRGGGDRGVRARPDFELDVPTTGTLTQGALWVVNARFSPTAAAGDFEYWITRLPTQP